MDKATGAIGSAAELLELAMSENDESMAQEIERDAGKLETDVRKLEFKRMFRGEMDSHNAFLDIQAGAGGTEAQDWAQMLLRMYLKWAASRGFEAEVFDSQAGEVAGLKSATIEIKGEFAYGWLRTETGVHRLVRKSPFDSGNRRHTSFASVFVSPEVDDDIKIDLNPADISMDVYRSSGAGGQHVNKTESAVRLTHGPSGIVVACQNERSQHKNRATAMKMLKAKLYELEVNKRNAASKVLEDSKSDVSLGQPDPFVCARPVAYQGSAHRRRNRRYHQGARRAPGSIHGSITEGGPVSESEENSLIAERRAKLAALREQARAAGAPAFPNDLPPRRAGLAAAGRIRGQAGRVVRQQSADQTACRRTHDVPAHHGQGELRQAAGPHRPDPDLPAARCAG